MVERSLLKGEEISRVRIPSVLLRAHKDLDCEEQVVRKSSSITQPQMKSRRITFRGQQGSAVPNPSKEVFSHFPWKFVPDRLPAGLRAQDLDSAPGILMTAEEFHAAQKLRTIK